MKKSGKLINLSTTKFLLFLCMAVLILSPAACRDQSGSHYKGTLEQRNPNVLALIGEEQITREDLEAAMERIPERRREVLRNKVLDALVEARVFAREATKAGLHDDPQVKQSLDRTTDETLARYFVKKYVDKEAEPSEEKLRKYYDEHKDQFVVPDGVMIQHILVKKQAEAEDVLKALKGGASFEELAKKKSIARSWEKGGRHGWLFRGKTDPELEKVAFGLEKGQLSDIIETEKGYEIIKVLDKRDKRQMPFEETRPRLRNVFFRKTKNELVNKFYEQAGVDSNPSEEGMLVRIGEEAISEDYLIPILGKVPDDQKVRQRWIKYLIETKVFSEQARKVHLEDDPDVALELRRKTDRILAMAFRERFMKDKFTVGDKEIEAFYQSHLAQFMVPPRVRVKSILVKTREEAEEILEQVKGGTSFAWLAVKKSLYPKAASRGGEIGWFGKGERDPALEKAAFSLEPGQISDIIKTKAGYEIIKLMARTGGETKPFDEVKQEIKMNCLAQKFEEEKQRYYEKAGVKILGT